MSRWELPWCEIEHRTVDHYHGPEPYTALTHSTGAVTLAPSPVCRECGHDASYEAFEAERRHAAQAMEVASQEVRALVEAYPFPLLQADDLLSRTLDALEAVEWHERRLRVLLDQEIALRARNRARDGETT